MLKRSQLKHFMTIVATLWIILSSNSLVYCIMNMKMSMAILLGITAIYIFLYGFNVSKKNLFVFFFILTICIFNILMNLEYTTLNENFIILFIRCFCLMVIMSSIEKKEFVHNYVNILVILSIISLVSFGITMLLGTSLPFQKEVTYESKYYIYTFYHTLGRWRIQDRNCGIFWEPGGYQIFLNFALLMLFTKTNLFIKRWGNKRYVISIAIIISTILTTLSTTGFICLAIVLIIGVLHRSGDKKMKRIIIIAILIASIAFIYLELQMGIIESKAIDQGGSFMTRYKDTVVSFNLGIQRFFGFGYSNTFTPKLLVQNGVTDNSSGLGALLIGFGLPVIVIYLIYIMNKLKQFFELNILEIVLCFILFVLFIMTENVSPITLFVMFLFNWKDDKSISNKQEVSCTYECDK